MRAQVVLIYVMPKCSAPTRSRLRPNRGTGPDNTIPLNLGEGEQTVCDEGQGPADGGTTPRPVQVQGKAISTQTSNTPATSGLNRATQAPANETQPSKTAIHNSKLKEKRRARIHYEGPVELKQRIERIAACLDVSARDAHVMVADEGVLVVERILRRKGKLP